MEMHLASTADLVFGEKNEKHAKTNRENER